LLAVTITKDHPRAAEFVDAVNTFYGNGNVPIGIVRDGLTKDEGKFLELAAEKGVDGKARFAHDLDGAKAPDAVALLRQVLAAQADGSVAIAQVGFFTNLARLLDSKADESSPLSGRDLVKAKVKVLSLMAGTFQTVDFNTRHPEYNVKIDVPSAVKLVKNWPTPMIWSGYEIGKALPYPHRSIEEDYNYVSNHPIKDAYYLYNPPPHDRPTWDLTSVLYAVYPDRGYFDFSPPGRVTVEPDGVTHFSPDKKGKGRDRYLILTPLQQARVLEALVQLSVEPPAPGAK
jgi:inosine-uridine nucleoside N-ribohydrolase